jgi:FkbM family methyltransferase
MALQAEGNGHGDKSHGHGGRGHGHDVSHAAHGHGSSHGGSHGHGAKNHGHGSKSHGQVVSHGHGHSHEDKDHARNSKAKIQKLLKDELFSPSHKFEGQAGTVSEGCDSWKGEGLHCETEYPEHALVRDWVPADAVVMEFGARFGTTSCEIARKLNNSGNVVVVEPDLNVWDVLEANLKSHQCNAHLLRGAVSSVDLHMAAKLNVKRGYSNRALQKGGVVVPGYHLHEVESALGKKVDTLLIDCEGCAQDMMDQLGPVIESGQIKLLLIEGDMPVGAKDCHSHCMDYKKFFAYLAKHGFEQVDKFNDCDIERTGAPKGKWCGKWIDHFAFQRK